jgi:hypothetical protein
VFIKGHRVKEINLSHIVKFKLKIDIKDDSLEYGLRMVDGKIVQVSPETIDIKPFSQKITKNNNCLKQTFETQYPYDTDTIRIAKKGIIEIDYTSYSRETLTSFSLSFIFLGSVTALLVAPLVSMNYKTGDFNATRYYRWAAIGLCTVGICIPITVLSGEG